MKILGAKERAEKESDLGSYEPSTTAIIGGDNAANDRHAKLKAEQVYKAQAHSRLYE